MRRNGESSHIRTRSFRAKAFSLVSGLAVFQPELRGSCCGEQAQVQVLGQELLQDIYLLSDLVGIYPSLNGVLRYLSSEEIVK